MIFIKVPHFFGDINSGSTNLGSTNLGGKVLTMVLLGDLANVCVEKVTFLPPYPASFPRFILSSSFSALSKTC